MIKERTATVAVVGIGYAGLPMAVEIARAGFNVVGFDLDARKVESVLAGASPVSNVCDDDIVQVRARLTASTDANVLADSNIVFICVPTPLTSSGDPDMGFVARAGATIGQHLRPGALVILQSTCAPGSTSGLLREALEGASGLRAGQEFHLVFAPERIDPGNAVFTVNNTPKLVGGTTEEAAQLACQLFETFIDSVVRVQSPEVAEMAKLVENTFRYINIGFINEMALLCDRLGVNVWEVIEAAKTKPFAFMPHYPSAGVGGHCIPVVPQYLEAAARQCGVHSELIEAANRVNRLMPRVVVDKLEAALNSRGRELHGSQVLVIGVTYKPDIADVRESAALRVIEDASCRGAKVRFHDPLIARLDVAGGSLESTPLTPRSLLEADAVLLLTPHSSVDFDLVLRKARLVVDTRNGLNPASGPNIVNIWTPQPQSETDDNVALDLAEAA